MAHYDELKPNLDDLTERHGPTVVRDCPNVREIAADPAAFLGHVKPRYKGGRDDYWRPDDE